MESKYANLELDMSPEALKGQYCNMVNILHSKEEFIIDFIMNMPPKAVVTTRVIISPAHAKRLMDALAGNVKQYDRESGKSSEYLELVGDEDPEVVDGVAGQTPRKASD